MLTVEIPESEIYDEKSEEFIKLPKVVLQLEHSLVSLSKWESKWCKPFLVKESKTDEELLDYIKCMTITQNVKPYVYKYFPAEVYNQINEYINAPMTATWIKENKSGPLNKRIITSEVIYGSMIALNIPMECQKWHLNRLTTLIKVCNENNTPQKKRSKREIMTERAALNKARLEQLNTRG